MKNPIILALLAVSFLVGGCASNQPPAPAVATISKAVPLSRVKGALIEIYLSDGWQFERESDHLVSFIRENTNALAGALYHTNYEMRVFNREIVVITENQSGYLLQASQAIISNYGSAFEKAQPTGTKAAKRLSEVTARLN